jgi:Leucine-rich repeat (LRR) protein
LIITGIRDLDRIEDCENLEILNISSNEINDLNKLRNLKKLQYLNLSCNQIRYLGNKQKYLNLENSIYKTQI